jgi:hypothetical protein
LTVELAGRALVSRDEVGAAAVDYLRILGHFAFAYFWARMAALALSRAGADDPIYGAKLATARFYFQRLLPEVESLFQTAGSGSKNLFELASESF